MNLDDLFGEGAELGDDVVVKAQLRFRVHPPKHPVAQDLVDRLVSSYDERLDMICGEIGDVLQHADLRRSARSHPLVLDLTKSPAGGVGQQVYAPGAKGGKWYRDGAGHIRYGEKPMPTYKPAPSEHVAPQISQYRPHPFMGMGGIDRDLTGFLMDTGAKHGFTKPELRFLGSWYGTSTKSGALFDAFLDCAGITREDLTGDITQLRFGSQNLTYEEAVFEFFAAQRALFMGEESDDEDPDADWEHILNDEIKPLLDSVFSKYEALKEDESFKESFSEEPKKLRRRFFANARKRVKSTRDVADAITSGWDPAKQTAKVIAGMRELKLFTKQSQVNNRAVVQDRPHLKDSTELDDRLLSDHGNPLLAEKEKLGELTPSQLMILYVAAEVSRRWDPDSRSYSTELQADIGSGALGEAAFTAIAESSQQWSDAAGLLHKHLDHAVDRVVAALNHANMSLDQPKQKTRRSKK